MRNRMRRRWAPIEADAAPREELQRAGLRPTLMRHKLLDLFERHRRESLSCEHVYRLLNEAGFTVSLAGTYYNIRQLYTSGVLARGEIRGRVGTCSTYALQYQNAQETV